MLMLFGGRDPDVRVVEAHGVFQQLPRGEPGVIPRVLHELSSVGCAMMLDYLQRHRECARTVPYRTTLLLSIWGVWESARLSTRGKYSAQSGADKGSLAAKTRRHIKIASRGAMTPCLQHTSMLGWASTKRLVPFKPAM
jgi:hypothetical protein